MYNVTSSLTILKHYSFIQKCTFFMITNIIIDNIFGIGDVSFLGLYVLFRKIQCVYKYLELTKK